MANSLSFPPKLNSGAAVSQEAKDVQSDEKALHKHYILALSYLTQPKNPEVIRQNAIWFDGKRIKAIERPILQPDNCVIFSEDRDPREASQYRGHKNSVIARIIVTASGEFDLQPLPPSFHPKYGICHFPHAKAPPPEFTSLLNRIAEEGFENVKQTLLE